MDAPDGKTRSQALLKRARKAEGAALSDLVSEIENALSTGTADSTDRIPFRIRARLNAYLEAAAFDRAGTALRLASNVAEATNELNEIVGHTLRFDVARNLLESYCVRWPDARPLHTLTPFLAGLTAPRDKFRDAEANDVQIVDKPDARTTFVVFTGIRYGFGIHLNLLHHACFAGVAANIVYVRDFSHCHYLTGIDSLGTLERTSQALRNIFARLGTEKLVMVGNSGGVFGALYYAMLLDAGRVLAFSGPSSLDIGVEHTERQVYAQLSELRSQGKIGWPDIRSLYAERNIPVSIYFGENNRFDRAQAENLQGLPNVSLHPFPTGHHFIVDDLVASGVFQAALSAAL